MYINKTDNSSFNFKAPEGATENSVNEVLFPISEVITDPDFAADVEIKQQTTFVTATITANKTLNLDINSQVSAGAIIHAKVASTGSSRVLTFGTGFTSKALTGVDTKTFVQSFIYDGTTFVAMGASLQID